MTPPTFLDPVQTLIPFGSICTFSGASGVGKTAFIATTVAQFQRGEPIFGHHTNPCPVGVLACDRPWRDHAAWFEKAGCEPFAHLSLRDIEYAWQVLYTPERPKIATIFGSLLDTLNLPPGSLLIVDPVALFIPGRLIDYKDVAIGMGLLDLQLKARQLTMIGIFHVSKQKAGGNDRYLRPQDRILGSSALLGYSETTFYLLSPEEAQKPHYEFGYVCHQLPAATFAYKRNPETGIFVPAEFLDLQHDEEMALSLLSENCDVTIARSVWVDKIRKTLTCDASYALAVVKRLWRAGRIERLGRGLYRRAKPH